MNNKLLKELQEYHYSLRDIDGRWRKNPIGFIYNAETSEKDIKTVKYILDIILDSDYISAETKIFIASKGINIRGVNEIINITRESKARATATVLKPLSYNNTCSKLQDDNDALDVYLGNRVLRDIVYGQVDDEARVAKRLLKFRDRFGDSTNYRENLELRLRDIKPKITSFKNNEEFFDILGSLEPYLAQRKEIIEGAINSNTEFIAYFNYLLSKQAIDNEEVKADRERLIRFLKNEDYSMVEDEEEMGSEEGSSSKEDSGVENSGVEDSGINTIEKVVNKDKIGVVPIENRNIQIDEDGTIKMDNYNMFKYDTPEENSDTSEKSDDTPADRALGIDDEDTSEFAMRVDKDIKVIL